MQIPRTGDLVRVRRARWRILDVRVFDGCRLVTLRGAGASNAGLERRVLSPFDAIDRIDATRLARFVRPRLWRRVCRAVLAARTPPGALRTAAFARMDLLPHQLEPALAIVRGLATRMLLADEVGLGKTIQTALIAAELLARGRIDRILIITPAGLRDQWASELGDRFGIDAVAVDAHVLRAAAATLPIGVNPWSTTAVAIASFDYVKRAEVLPAASACAWDLVIVDEAHTCGADSDRRAAVHALAAQASYVLLLTATPHNGDREAFAALCGVGAVDETPLVVFRRTRAEVGLPTRRRVHLLRVRTNAAEQLMHRALRRYSDALRDERQRAGAADPCLPLSVLHKRAFSSAWSLAASVERRLADLAAGADAAQATTFEQLALPIGDPTGEIVAADEPPLWPADLRLEDASRERRLLKSLMTAARSASAVETKLRVLRTLLRRVREPAIVFTEYRDTLLHVARQIACHAVVLHGGLRREDRKEALAAFQSARAAVLLATDAAAEGLNLQASCRLVVNLELPWNPMRLEQRIGRVDRIGQQRTVHAFHLVVHDTGEARIADRLRSRVAVAAADIGATDPLGNDTAIARMAITGDEFDDPHNAEPRGGCSG